MDSNIPTTPTKGPGCYLGHNLTKCPNMKETYSNMEGERYRCALCNQSYYLDYEDMK